MLFFQQKFSGDKCLNLIFILLCGSDIELLNNAELPIGREMFFFLRMLSTSKVHGLPVLFSLFCCARSRN
jgi:hypothetical protein